MEKDAAGAEPPNRTLDVSASRSTPPTVDLEYCGGDGVLYLQLVEQDVMPMINARFRTRTGAENTGVAGSSLGGLISMWFGLQRSNLFTRIGVISPSIWWDNRVIVSQVNNLSGKLPLRIWEDMGSAESTNAVSDARALRTALITKGWTTDEIAGDLHYAEIEGGMHNEAAWAARLDGILQFLFPP